MIAARALPAPSGQRLARAGLLLAMLVIAQSAVAQDNPQLARRLYDITAQPLDGALSRFSEVSGIDVLLRAPSASPRCAPALRGVFTPFEALARLLENSGLTVRFTSAHSAIIVPVQRPSSGEIVRPEAADEPALIRLDTMRVAAPRVIGAPRRPDMGEAYANALVVAIRRIVIDRGLLAGGHATDLRIATRIAPDGRLHDITILKGSKDAGQDARVVALLDGMVLGPIPPAGLRQPLIFEVSGR